MKEVPFLFFEVLCKITTAASFSVFGHPHPELGRSDVEQMSSSRRSEAIVYVSLGLSASWAVIRPARAAALGLRVSSVRQIVLRSQSRSLKFLEAPFCLFLEHVRGPRVATQRMRARLKLQD